MATRAAAPPYDDILVQARAQGNVVVTVEVLPSGEVADARVTETFWPPMNELLEGYAETWRFEAGPKTTLTRIVFAYVFVPEDAPETELGWRLVAPSTVEIRHVAPKTEISREPDDALER